MLRHSSPAGSRPRRLATIAAIQDRRTLAPAEPTDLGEYSSHKFILINGKTNNKRTTNDMNALSHRSTLINPRDPYVIKRRDDNVISLISIHLLLPHECESHDRRRVDLIVRNTIAISRFVPRFIGRSILTLDSYNRRRFIT